MKNQILCGLILALTFCNEIQAQKRERPERIRKPSPWNTLSYKNEISLDGSPVVAFIINTAGAFQAPVSFGLTYRRFFTKSDAFRFGYRSNFLMFDAGFNENRFHSAGFRPVAPGRIDSIILFRKETRSTERRSYHTFRPGYEHRFGSRRVKFILGVDLMLGFEHWYRSNDTILYEKTIPFDVSGGAQEYPVEWFNHPDFDEDWFWGTFGSTGYNYYDSWSFVMGGATVIGLNIHLTQRWSLTGTLIYELYGYIPFKQSAEPVSNKIKPRWNIGYESYVADISLTFRF